MMIFVRLPGKTLHMADDMDESHVRPSGDLSHVGYRRYRWRCGDVTVLWGSLRVLGRDVRKGKKWGSKEDEKIGHRENEENPYDLRRRCFVLGYDDPC